MSEYDTGFNLGSGLDFGGGSYAYGPDVAFPVDYSSSFSYTPTTYDNNYLNFGVTNPYTSSSYDSMPFFGDQSASSPFGSMTYEPATSSLWDSISGGLGSLAGSTSGYDWAKLGIGGLSLLGNYLSSSNSQDLAEEKLKQEMALARQKLGLEREAMELGRDTDLAKVDAMMRLVKERQGVGALDPRRYAQIVASGQIPADVLASQGIVDIGEQRQMADGGYYAGGGASQQGALSLLRGASGGQADDVNARLSHGEYVMDAESVSALGDGNTEAGARKLDQMRESIRMHKRSAPVDKIPPKAKDPMSYMKKGR